LNTLIDILLLILCLGAIVIVFIVALRQRSLRLLMVTLTLVGIGMAIFIPAFLKARPVSTPSSESKSGFVPSALSEKPRPANNTNATSIELGAAESGGLVEVKLTDADLQALEVTLKLRGANPLEVIIPAGAVFASQSSGVQNMMVRVRQTVLLTPSDPQAAVTIDVACINMTRNVPTAYNKLTIGQTLVSGDLLKLLQNPEFLHQSFRIQQFAIWTITDNPSLTQYVGITSSGVGGYPSDAELQSVRNLLIKSGIDTGKYKAMLK
jgi:hypothetical protein